ncbi:MAG TPA: protein kinase [Gemmatimonadales bacterium]|nr:protein kinase [Gemmatimonadales bacterium]
MRLPLGTRIFLGTALVVTAVLGIALLITKRQADRAAESAALQALRATQAAIHDALGGRSQTLSQLTSALVQVPVYVSRIGESVRSGNRADLLDQADELRSQTGADWVLITDPSGVLRAWTSERDLFDQDFSGGALIGRALEGKTTSGLWVEPTETGDQLYQAVAMPVSSPGSATPLAVVAAALRIDSTFAARLRRNTNSEIVFFSLDTAGTPHVAASTVMANQSGGRALSDALRGLGIGTVGSSDSRIHLTLDNTDYEGTVGSLTTADSVQVGGYLGLHSRDADLAAYQQLRRTIRWAFLIGLLLAVGFSLLAARHIVRPVQRLVAATRKVTRGEYTGVIDVGTRDEIGDLAHAFGTMVEELREKDRLVQYLRTGAAATEVVSDGKRDGQGLLATGRLFAGRYEIQESLGAGGMGVVYRAFDRQVGEALAIKVIRSDVGQLDPTLLERFKQELRLARRITHRNVVRTFDLGESDGIYYITMEYVRGTTVSALIKEAGRLDVAAALTIGKQVCRALEVAHEAGIVHRDIKPQNLLVDPTGFLKVTDFGIARLAGTQTDGKALTVDGMIVGTPAYMSPEQLLGEPVDGRSDIYATGAVLFECLTGRRVFESSGTLALVAHHLRQEESDPTNPAELNPEVPESFSRAIVKALARKPEARWPSASDFLRALEAVETHTLSSRLSSPAAS